MPLDFSLLWIVAFDPSLWRAEHRERSPRWMRLQREKIRVAPILPGGFARERRVTLRMVEQTSALSSLLDQELGYAGRGVELLHRGHSSDSGG
jgi:hypothetical protein